MMNNVTMFALPFLMGIISNFNVFLIGFGCSVLSHVLFYFVFPSHISMTVLENFYGNYQESKIIAILISFIFPIGFFSVFASFLAYCGRFLN